jgi:hypothetical protein
MKIGNLPEIGKRAELGKWYFWLEIYSRPSYILKGLRPCVFFGVRKYLDFGEPQKLDGRLECSIGFSKYWISPRGIVIEII